MIELLSLLEFYNTYDHEDIFFKIAEKMISNFDTIEKMDMQALSEYLYISNSTLYRFVKTMGYDNFNQMKDYYRGVADRYYLSGKYYPDDGTSQSVQEYASFITRQINDIASRIHDEQITRITEKITSANTIIFAGMPLKSSVWRLQIELVLLKKRTNAFLNPMHQIEEIHSATKDDLIFLMQTDANESEFYTAIIAEAQSKQIPVILLTTIPTTKLKDDVSEVISIKGTGTESDHLLIEFVLQIIGQSLHQYVIDTI